MKADDRTRVKIAWRRQPAPPYPPAPGMLAFGSQPDAFGRPVAGGSEQVYVGRPGLGDRTNRRRQNKALAATMVAAVSDPMAR